MRNHAFFLAIGLLLGPALAGCTTPTDVEAARAAPSAPGVRLLENGGFAADVPIDVYLLGFPREIADALAERLEPTPIDHSVLSSPLTFPPDLSDPARTPLTADTFSRALVQPTAVFEVHDLDTALDGAFLAATRAWKVPEAPNLYDANAAEAWIADALRAQGVALDRQAPALVILHTNDVLGQHRWRQTFSHGHLDHVRIFGERELVTIFDVSAQEDPYVMRDVTKDPNYAIDVAFNTALNSGTGEDQPYNHPLPARGEETVDALALLAVHAAHFRFLKGPAYPVSTAPCHHVTLLFAVHTTALSDAKLPEFRSATDWVDPARLERHFENLTGSDVRVELRVLMLPQDDPVLDALARGATALVTLDALRWYLQENWERFVTPHEGCEEYLSFLLYGDAAAQGAFGGVGLYDVERGRRISISRVWDVQQLAWDPALPEPTGMRPHDFSWDMINHLYAHETGHIFGQHHPQHYFDAAGRMPTNAAFEGVYSVMTYQTVYNSDFGAADFATWNLARAGYTIRDARALGLEGTPAFDEALVRLGENDWEGAHAALEPHLAQRVTEASSQLLPAFHAATVHAHPWRSTP